MRVIAFALVFSSFSAIAACPDLAGTYSICRSATGASNGSSDMVVTQTVNNGVTTYTFTSTDDDTQERITTTAIADGKPRTTVENDPNWGEFQSTEIYSCSDGKVVGNLDVKLQGQEIVVLDMESHKNGDSLEIDSNGMIFGQNIQDKVICE